MNTRYLIAALLLLVAGLQSAKAQEAYTVLNDGTLTFYYDNLRSSRPGTSYNLNRGDFPPDWRREAAKVKSAVFDPSFANAKPNSTVCWFSEMENLTSITGMEYLNTSYVSYMGFMFSGCSSLTSLDLSHLDTDVVTDMSAMFQSCSSLTSLDLSHFNTINVADMSFMFMDCSSLTSLDLSHLDTWSVTNMGNMFKRCLSLTSLDVHNFNTWNVTDMSDMFALCESLTSLDLSSFNTSRVRNMSYMFWDCCNLKNLDLRYFDTRDVTNMSNMFCHCWSLTSLDLSNFNTKNVTNMGGMFSECTGLKSLNLSGFNTSSTRKMSSMFDLCKSLTSLDLSNFNTENVEDMSYMFAFCEALTSLDLSNFDTSNVCNPSDWLVDGFIGMFSGCSSLTSLNISHFNIEKADCLMGMFQYCSSLTSLDLSSFNTKNIWNYEDMFTECEKLKTIYVGTNWDTEGDKDKMFEGCVSLVGGAGTTFDADHIDATYAHVDGGPSSPGYLTLKASTADEPFEVDHIYYKEISGSATVEVTYKDTEYGTYSGTVEIPENVISPENGMYYVVTTIGERAFYQCPYLQHLTLPATIDRIENEAFVNAFLDASNSDITCLATTPPTISPYAFGSEMQNMTLYVLKDCKAAYMAHNVWKNFGNIVELPYHFQDGKVFYAITGPNTVSVVHRTPSYNSYWGQVTIPFAVKHKGITYTVTEIGNVAFLSSSQLTRVFIPSTVTKIGNRSFKDCPLLTSITIPENVTSIGTMCFDGCNALTDITCLAKTPPSISYDTFTESHYQGASLYVPYGCESDYRWASVWELFYDVFELPIGIKDVKANDNDNVTIYDLSGQKLAVPNKGINIVNGKKVLIR